MEKVPPIATTNSTFTREVPLETSPLAFVVLSGDFEFGSLPVVLAQICTRRQIRYRYCSSGAPSIGAVKVKTSLIKSSNTLELAVPVIEQFLCLSRFRSDIMLSGGNLDLILWLGTGVFFRVRV
jgi:hypothetical protein